MLYTGRKREVYQRAVDSLMIKGLTPRDAFLKCFVKAEKINFTAKPDPAPRVIQPRDPRFNAMLGRFIKVMEHYLYQAIDRVYRCASRLKTVTKGMNAGQVGQLIAQKWAVFKRPVAIILDAKRFDQHVRKEMLQWEHKVYLDATSGDKAELAWLLNMQIENQAFGYVADGKLKYKVSGNRMSGDMNTASGNVVLMCAMMYEYMIHLGVSKYELVNNGDDSVLIVEGEEADRTIAEFEPFFIPLGFEMDIQGRTSVFEKIKFCQCSPVRTPEGVVMVRSMESLAKDCVSIKPLETEKVYRRWLKSIGECGLSLAGGIPVVGAFYKLMLRSGRGQVLTDPSMECGMQIMARGMDRAEQTVHWTTRVSFYYAFGVLPDEQIAVEGEYDRMELPYDNVTDPSHPCEAAYNARCLPPWILNH